MERALEHARGHAVVGLLSKREAVPFPAAPIDRAATGKPDRRSGSENYVLM